MSGQDETGDLKETWLLTPTRATLLCALHDQPRSIRALQRETGSDRKTIRKELLALTEAEWVEEISENSGPHRIHKLTPTGQEICERLLVLVELCKQKDPARDLSG